MAGRGLGLGRVPAYFLRWENRVSPLCSLFTGKTLCRHSRSLQMQDSVGSVGARPGPGQEGTPRPARPAPWVFSPGSSSCSLTAPHRASTQAGPPSPSPSDGASSPRGGGATEVAAGKHILGPSCPREAELVGAAPPPRKKVPSGGDERSGDLGAGSSWVNNRHWTSRCRTWGWACTVRTGGLQVPGGDPRSVTGPPCTYPDRGFTEERRGLRRSPPLCPRNWSAPRGASGRGAAPRAPG